MVRHGNSPRGKYQPRLPPRGYLRRFRKSRMQFSCGAKQKTEMTTISVHVIGVRDLAVCDDEAHL